MVHSPIRQAAHHGEGTTASGIQGKKRPQAQHRVKQLAEDVGCGCLMLLAMPFKVANCSMLFFFPRFFFKKAGHLFPANPFLSAFSEPEVAAVEARYRWWRTRNQQHIPDFLYSKCIHIYIYNIIDTRWMLARWSQICRPMLAPHVSQSLSLAGWKIIFWSLVVKWICFLWSTEILALPRNELPLSLTTSSDLHADQFPCLTNYWVHFHLIQYCSPPMSLLVEGGFKQASAIEVKSKAEMRRRLPLCLYWHIQIVNVYIYIL